MNVQSHFDGLENTFFCNALHLKAGEFEPSYARMAGLRVPKDTYKPGDLEKLLEKSGQVNYQSAGAGIYILTSQQNSPSSPNLEYFILLQSFEQYKGRTKWCFNDCMYCIPPPKLFSYHPFVNIHKHFSLPFLFIPPQIHPCFSISAKNFPSPKGRGK